jgi:hypothetical protein
MSSIVSHQNQTQTKPSQHSDQIIEKQDLEEEIGQLEAENAALEMKRLKLLPEKTVEEFKEMNGSERIDDLRLHHAAADHGQRLI